MVELNDENGIEELVLSLCNFGYRDVKAAVDVLRRYQISNNDFADYVEEFMDSTGTNLVNRGEALDICALAYDHALQLARQHIEEYTGLDIMNDADYNVYGNYCCSQIDYTEDGKDRLIEAVCASDDDDRQTLLDHYIVRTFFEDVEILDRIEKCHGEY